MNYRSGRDEVGGFFALLAPPPPSPFGTFQIFLKAPKYISESLFSSCYFLSFLLVLEGMLEICKVDGIVNGQGRCVWSRE